ncbi:MAG: oligoendopeptidase F [Candidatus Lernaella stagnicola]|nr:oligoendopeptidase F [Candidatus Lernaella stagnicola]
MTRLYKVRFTAFVLVVLLVFAAVSVAKERTGIPDEFKWDVTALFPSLDAFQQEKDAFAQDIKSLGAYQGKLHRPAKRLGEALDLYYSLELRMRHMESYTSRLADQDAQVAQNKALQSQISSLRARFEEAASFIDPEIVAMGERKIERLIRRRPELENYAFPLREKLRKQKHILSPEEERILAAAGDVADAGYYTYNIFANADLPFPTVTLADGSQIKLTYSNFNKVRRGLDPGDRKMAFETIFGLYGQFKRTIAEMLQSQLKSYRFFAKMRGYDSSLEMSMDDDHIPTAIYHSLIEAAHRNLPTFHRYLKLKAKALGKEKLHYYDMYLPFTEDVTIDVTWERAESLLLEALQPLGDEYINTVRSAFRNGWIDVYPNDGKDSGAYASGWAYGTHPYILMNYTGSYQEALTLAHEMGHAMHSNYSNAAQPFPTSYYSTFTAEVASTFNENLLNDLMLTRVKNEDERLYLLGNFLDGTIKGTFFRQIQFAEFELMMHEAIAKGEALTGEKLNKMFLDLARKYYGHDEGIVEVPEIVGAEWSVVPHFYYNFYVYQYATSVAAASVLSQKVIAKEPGALEAYYDNLLKAGGSDHPVNLLQRAGADMTKPAAYDALMERANRYMDALEEILAARGN